MKSSISHPIKVLVTGFIVLVLFSIPLFWGRWICETILVNIMPHNCMGISMQPSGLVPSEFENDPNVAQHSHISAQISTEEASLFSFGIADYFISGQPKGRHSNIYHLNKDRDDESWSWMYFDKKVGQIVCQYTDRQRMPDKSLRVRQVQLYAGPEGVSETSDKALGRFIQPVAESPFYESSILYDQKLHRFFKINFKEKAVTKGPELVKADIHKPIQIGLIKKGQSILDLYWSPPYLKSPDEDSSNRKPIVERDYSWDKRQYLLVLDETGRIYQLDRETLEFAKTAGHLPVPESLFPSRGFVTPKGLLGYEVLPLSLRTDNKYRGMFAASVSREGTSMTLNVFDEKGSLINQVNTTFSKSERRDGRFVSTSTSKAVFWEVPWAPTLTISKFLLENLHPPILSLFSYFTANSIEASAGHRALFVLPNSFIAMKGRDVSKHTTERFFDALLIILPSIIFSIILVWRVSIGATAAGLSENTKLFWKLATIGFGLAAYITYRIIRPGITLVTCANCGKMRRPDMDRCHRCGSKWQVPELTPPVWRVVDT